MPNIARSHAVVIGAGMAGLTAAQAISRHFEKVTIIERDVLPAEAAPRSGTPQAQHAHTLLAGGLQALKILFPGFENDLAAAGAVKIRTGRDIRFERPGFDPFPVRDLGFDIFCMSRPLLEAVTRRRVQQSPNIDLCVRSRATRLVASLDAMRVEAVRYDSEDGPVTLEADLVVDASGRCGLTLKLLEELSLPKPEESEIGMIRRTRAPSSSGRSITMPTGSAISYCRPRPPAAAGRSCFRSRSSDGCSPSEAITAMRLPETARDSWISSGACALRPSMTRSGTPDR
jgi:2-polyprenyl-6-methoxyphenol hydroxylase-like FAD-dependent oxidoreductase